MNKIYTKLISMMLALFICLTGVGCETTQPPNDSENISETTEDPATAFAPLGEYYIVRNEYMLASADTLEAMRYIRRALDEVYGNSNTRLSDDWYRESEGLVPHEYEILIGYTNRPQSKELFATLKSDDYAYHVESENVIVICGGSPAATFECVKKFCSDAFGYTGEGTGDKTKLITEGMSYTYRAEYDFDEVLIDGIPIEEYTLAVSSMVSYYEATAVTAIFSQYNGYNIPIKLYSELDGSENSVICLGASFRDQTHARKLGANTFLIKTTKDSNGLTLGIDYEYNTLGDEAIEKLKNSVSIAKKDGKAEITLPEDELYGYDFEADIPEWRLVSENKKTVADGVIYIEQAYTDENLKPYKAYILVIDPSKAAFYMGTTNDGYEYSLTGITKQNVVSHMKAAAGNGINAIAGVNADFFDISGDYHPRGLAIKKGQVISLPGSRPWFGVTKDGKAVIGSPNDYEKNYVDKLETAVGGSHIIVTDSLPGNISMETEMGYTAHPRTLVGICEDGTVILAVVDGRQASISNGAPLARCAMLMIEHGAVTALNLDGGGSSCMVIKSGTNYNTMNSPSDGSLRKVYNSLLVVPIS